MSFVDLGAGVVPVSSLKMPFHLHLPVHRLGFNLHILLLEIQFPSVPFSVLLYRMAISP